MTAEEQIAWLLRELHIELRGVHFKLDKLVRCSTRAALTSPTSGPTGPTAPTSTAPSTQRSWPKLAELVKELLWPAAKALAKWIGERLAMYGLSHLLPALGLAWLIGWEALSRIWAWLAWLLP
jgi:hypothetical protein